MDVKSTKIKELQQEVKTYQGECVRLRKLAESAIEMTGEIEVKREMRRSQQEAASWKEEVDRLKGDLF